MSKNAYAMSALAIVGGGALAFAATNSSTLADAMDGTISVVRGAVGLSNAPLDASASTPLAAGVVADAPATGCQSRSARYPWGAGAFRTWTPVDASRPAGTPGNYDSSGTRTGAPFSARLVQAWGRDAGDSRQSAIFEMPDGCRREFRSASFIAADVAVINQGIAAHPFAPDPNSYATSLTEEQLVTPAQVSSGVIKTYETQHFNIVYGVKTNSFSYLHEASAKVPWSSFISTVARTFEDAWQIDRYILEAPMPYAKSANRKKINIYICGTGLLFGENGDANDCGATGAAAVFVDSQALDSTATVVHEFGHTIQYYSGGFRDKPSAGPIWETGAEWTSFTQSQTGEYFFVNYLSNLENGPLWSNTRYASFPYMSFLFEQDKTRPFVWSGWTGNLRDANGATTEEWTETLLRQAKAAGVYPAGYLSFADDMGWYGARLVAMDFLHQQALNDLRNADEAANFYTPLETGVGGRYASSQVRPLRQWGTHIVPLTPSADQVSVTVQGATTKGSAAWRVVLVSVGADGTPRYSAMGKLTGTTFGSTTLARKPNEKMYLAVTATPLAYASLGWQPDNAPVTGTAYPYTVKITGATALTTPASKCTSAIAGHTGSNLNYNTNGHLDGSVPCV